MFNLAGRASRGLRKLLKDQDGGVLLEMYERVSCDDKAGARAAGRAQAIDDDTVQDEIVGEDVVQRRDRLMLLLDNQSTDWIR